MEKILQKTQFKFDDGRITLEIDEEAIFKKVLAKHVMEDAIKIIFQRNLNNIFQMPDEEITAIAKYVGEAWAYDGDYDNDLGYWDNIMNLIVEGLRIVGDYLL